MAGGAGGQPVDPEPYRLAQDHVTLTVQVTPKASRSGFAGVIERPDGRLALAVRVAAPPVEGAANAALMAFLSKQLGVSKSSLGLASGETSRLKVVEVHGNPQEIADRLGAILAPLRQQS